MTEDEMLMTVSEMKAEVEKHGYTLAQLERFTAVPAAAISRIFSGKTKKPRRETMLALSAVLRPFVFEKKPGENKGFGEEEVYEPRAAYSYADQKGQEKHTIDDYLALPKERRVELIDGVFYDLAAPTFQHQLLLSELCTDLNLQLRRQGNDCHALAAPVDVQLDENDCTMVQPDILLVCEPGSIKHGRYSGAPGFVIEILSPSDRRKDMFIKSRKYRQAGVREYWMVDLQEERVIVQYFEKGEDHIYRMDEIVPLQISDGRIQIDFAAIMRGMRHFFREL